MIISFLHYSFGHKFVFILCVCMLCDIIAEAEPEEEEESEQSSSKAANNMFGDDSSSDESSS